MQQADETVSREAYLKLEADTGIKHEFYRGKVYAMTGGTFHHARISLNIAASLQRKLRGKSCQPMNSDMRIHTPSGLDTYPDISIYCGEPELSDGKRTLLNPVVIFEVLSPTTSSYDRGDKFALYRAVLTLEAYVLVDSEQVLVEYFRRIRQDEWLLHEYRHPADTVAFTTLEVSLSLAEIYEDVVFGE